MGIISESVNANGFNSEKGSEIESLIPIWSTAIAQLQSRERLARVSRNRKRDCTRVGFEPTTFVLRTKQHITELSLVCCIDTISKDKNRGVLFLNGCVPRGV